MARTMRSELLNGATDGKYFKKRPNISGGEMNAAADVADRSSLEPSWNYGTFQEAPVKVLPDGLTKA